MHLHIFLVSTLSGVSFLLLYIISVLYIVAIIFISGFGAGNKMIDPRVILAMPFNLYHRNTQFLLWQCHLT